MAGMRKVCVRLPVLALVAIAAMGAAGVVPATAQTVDDATTAEFQPSADHSVTLDGVPLVTSYLLQFFPAGSSSPSHSIDIGKPAPDPDGLIRFRFTSQLPTPLVPGTTYEARVSAVGPGGSSASGVSNPFTGPLPPPCTYAINPTSRNNVAAGGESISVAVTAASGCNWPATTSPVSWIVVSGGSGSGNGTVTLNVTANTATTPRNATVTIAGQPFAVTQSGACTFAINPTSRNNVAAAGEAISVAVTAASGCTWPATTSPVSWIVVSGGSGSGNGTVTLNVTANTATTQRNATVTIAGRPFAVTQVGACDYTVTPASLSVPSTGAASTFSIGTTAGCSWTATGMPSWITIPSGQQTGPGSLSYTIAANTGAARSATLTIAGKSVLVSQAANTLPAPPTNLRIVRSGGP